jgi:hypothetical protein
LTSWPGPLQERAALGYEAARHAANCTELEALVVGQAASWPKWHVQTDRQAAALLVKKNGKSYHPGSYGRARRSVTAKGIIAAKRIYPNERLPGLPARSRAGTTRRRVLFGATKPIARRDPLSAAELRQQHEQYVTIERDRLRSDIGTETNAHDARPRHSAPVPRGYVSPTTRNEFAAMANDAVRAQQERAARRATRRDERGLERDQDTIAALKTRRDRAPPDG